MAYILNILYVAVVVVLMFGAAIFVHEFGHFWVARKRGLKVEAFAIGFGPKVFGWTRDGIEYSLRLIPAGGYVKLPQMVTSSAIEGESAEKVPPASPFSKILVALAGPAMNVVFAFAIATVIYFVGLPVPVNPPIVGYVEPNSPEQKLGIREGDRIISVNGKTVKSWQDVQMNTVFALTNTIPVVVERDGQRTTYQLTSRVSEVIGLKILNLDPKEHPVVRGIQSGSPGEKAGLQLKDEFISFGDVPVASVEQLIEFIRKRPNEPTEITVKRGAEKLKLSITPALNPDTKQGRIGVELAGSDVMRYELQKPGPTPWQQVSTVWQRTVDTLSALFHSKQTGVGVKDLSGPPGILAMLASQVNADFRLALSFLVLLNINLAVLNLLPVPVLDGGHIMMAIIEKIFGKPLNTRFVEYTTTAFAVLLISFMLFVSFNDVTKRFSLFKSMFQHETRIDQPEGSNAPAK